MRVDIENDCLRIRRSVRCTRKILSRFVESTHSDSTNLYWKGDRETAKGSVVLIFETRSVLGCGFIQILNSIEVYSNELLARYILYTFRGFFEKIYEHFLISTYYILLKTPRDANTYQLKVILSVVTSILEKACFVPWS